MFKGLANLGSMLKSAREMGGKLEGVTEQLKTQRATGSAGGGMVDVEVNGLGEVLRVRIDPKLIAEGDCELIEDLIPAATNQAIIKSKQLHAEAMQAITAGMNLLALDNCLIGAQGGRVI